MCIGLLILLWTAEALAQSMGEQIYDLAGDGSVHSQDIDDGVAFLPKSSITGVQPDLFTGGLNSTIQIDVPQGRAGIQPQLNLIYHSAIGNGWVGKGWRLDLGSIERQTKNGLGYLMDDFVLMLEGSARELVKKSPDDGYFWSKFEGSFTRVQKLSAPDGKPYFQTTDRSGVAYRFGYSSASRIGDPVDATKIFKWCLDRVEDPDGNYMTVTYVGDQGQGYIDRIDYTGNGTLAPTNTVKFYRESRPDAADMYTTNFKIKTAYRLKTIEVRAGGGLVRVYKLSYTVSARSGRSTLTSVQQVGKDATIDAAGTVSGGATLPAQTFGYASEGTDAFQSQSLWLREYGGPIPTSFVDKKWFQFHADFNGDGLEDYMYWSNDSFDAGYGWFVALNNGGGGFDTPIKWLPGEYTGNFWNYLIFVRDINGDGMADLLYFDYGEFVTRTIPATRTPGWYVALSTGSGLIIPTLWLPPQRTNMDSVLELNRHYAADLNGDGKADYLFYKETSSSGGCNPFLATTVCPAPTTDSTAGWYAVLSTGAGFQVSSTPWLPKNGPNGTSTFNYQSQFLSDINGDGKPDWMYYWNGWYVALNNGAGFNTPSLWLPTSSALNGTLGQFGYQFLGDFNGDGKLDYAYHASGLYVAVNNGAGFNTPTLWLAGSGPGGTTANTNGQYVADLNGDGRSDWMYFSSGNGWYVALSNGTTMATPTKWVTLTGPNGEANTTWDPAYSFVTDLNMDGKQDFLYHWGSHGGVNRGGWWAVLSNVGNIDLLSSITNELGGNWAVSYRSSSRYNNTYLPIVLPTVSAVTHNDGNGIIGTTAYTYAGGFYHAVEREFRGFNYVKVTGPVGSDGTGTVSENWFHQGNDLTIANDPDVPVGYMKSKPYYTRISDQAGRVWSNSSLEYHPDIDGAAPYITPVKTTRAFACDGTVCAKEIRTDYLYDQYGNVTREDQYGDTSDATDDRTLVRAFSPNQTVWIIDKPTSETTYQGIGTANQVAASYLYYDGTTSCSVASTNLTPTKGHRTHLARWLSGGTNPETRAAYDAMGNLICTRDPLGNTVTVTYDSSLTFPLIVTNPIGHQIVTQYYGVGGVAADLGLYGQIKNVTDPNSKVTNHEYDMLGRKTKMTNPDGAWTTTGYNNFGTVGAQHVMTTTSLGLSTWTYFDGYGRTVMSRSPITSTQNVTTELRYDVRGQLSKVSTPYVAGIGTPRWHTVTFDALGRMRAAIHPDLSKTLSCYDSNSTVMIDANGHRKRYAYNGYGTIKTVHEYSGFYITCDTTIGTPYATTNYQYDVKGNLQQVIDTKGNQTQLVYDSIGRRTSIRDPDSGSWSYTYDLGDNLLVQTDATGDSTFLRYDALNRLIQKDFTVSKPVGSGDAMYGYDGPVGNRNGRLRQVQSASSTVSYQYDSMGRPSQRDEVMDGVTYTIQSTFDGLGRIKTITYPDNSLINYAYNGAVLSQVSQGATIYLSYNNHNELGLPELVTFGNGVTTTFSYSKNGNALCPNDNFTLCTIKTIKGTNPAYQDLQYGFDLGGNVQSITDLVNGNQTFSYDAFDRLVRAIGPYGTLAYSYDAIGNMTYNSQVGTLNYPPSGANSVRPHAVMSVGSQVYIYDANGNRRTGDGCTVTFCRDNRAISLNKNGVVTTNTFDPDGNRDKQVLGATTTRYLSKLYECDNGSCTRYIFADGQRRVALPASGGSYYYHLDHLGSTTVVTDQTGSKVQALTYYPFGKTRTNVPGTPVDVPYKYTGQELDRGSGLYFYEARYYDQNLGQFLSADTAEVDLQSPQSLNRYAYVYNNPMRYTDPSGNAPEEVLVLREVIVTPERFDRTFLDFTQEAIHFVAIVPVLNTPLETVNTVISVVRGNYGEATANALFAVPVLGTVGKIAKTTHNHHLFPVQFKELFDKLLGIKIDNFKVAVDAKFHREVLHSNNRINPGGEWNRAWQEFFAGKNIDVDKAFALARDLMNRFGIPGADKIVKP